MSDNHPPPYPILKTFISYAELMDCFDDKSADSSTMEFVDFDKVAHNNTGTLLNDRNTLAVLPNYSNNSLYTTYQNPNKFYGLFSFNLPPSILSLVFEFLRKDGIRFWSFEAKKQIWKSPIRLIKNQDKLVSFASKVILQTSNQSTTKLSESSYILRPNQRPYSPRPPVHLIHQLHFQFTGFSEVMCDIALICPNLVSLVVSYEWQPSQIIRILKTCSHLTRLVIYNSSDFQDSLAEAPLFDRAFWSPVSKLQYLSLEFWDDIPHWTPHLVSIVSNLNKSKLKELTLWGDNINVARQLMNPIISSLAHNTSSLQSSSDSDFDRVQSTSLQYLILRLLPGTVVVSL